MNYGYSEGTPGWDDTKKEELIQRLNVEVTSGQHKPEKGYENYTPYLEIDGPFGGVRVRRITHLQDIRKLIEHCDNIYQEVMNFTFARKG